MNEKSKKSGKHETENIKALIQVQKQLPEHSTAELRLLHGDISGQEKILSQVQEPIENGKEHRKTEVEPLMKTAMCFKTNY